jgi:hypothetical protein
VSVLSRKRKKCVGACTGKKSRYVVSLARLSLGAWILSLCSLMSCPSDYSHVSMAVTMCL